jgi:hypothetical protein
VARAAVKQPHAQPLFEPLRMGADGRFGNFEAPSHRRKAAAFYHAGKGGDAFERVHWSIGSLSLVDDFLCHAFGVGELGKRNAEHVHLDTGGNEGVAADIGCARVVPLTSTVAISGRLLCAVFG